MTALARRTPRRNDGPLSIERGVLSSSAEHPRSAWSEYAASPLRAGADGAPSHPRRPSGYDGRSREHVTFSFGIGSLTPT